MSITVKRQQFPREFPGVHYYDEEEEAAVRRVIRERSPFRYYGANFLAEADSHQGVAQPDEAQASDGRSEPCRAEPHVSGECTGSGSATGPLARSAVQRIAPRHARSISWTLAFQSLIAE